jgi:UDP-N-acetylmuramoyl-tripeptide--D-alanyl-D-alanine ligase
MSATQIVDALSTVKLSAMRFEQVISTHGALYISDAYNASPTSMEAAISTFADLFPERQKVLVLGDMYELGSDSDEMHAQVGSYANDLRDRFSMLVTVGEHSRHFSDAFVGKKLHVATKEEAVAALLPLRDANHAFLFKASRGMELWTIITDLERQP